MIPLTCLSGVYCQHCRDPKESAWRLRNANSFGVEGSEFECVVDPVAKPWGWKPVQVNVGLSAKIAQEVAAPKPELTESQKQTQLEVFHAAWDAIHNAEGVTPETWPAFYAGVMAKIPGCPCKKNADAILAKMPPEFGPDYCKWTWRFHNAVRSHLGQVELSWEEAKEVRGWNFST